MPANPTPASTTRRRGRTLFGVWFALFAVAALGLGAASGGADPGNGNGANNANGNPGHTPNQNHGGTQQGQQHETPGGGRGIPGCGPSGSKPKKCHDEPQTPTAPETPGTPGTPAAPSAPGGSTSTPGTTPESQVLGERTSGGGGGKKGSKGNKAAAHNGNAAAQPARAVKRTAAFTG
jgi:hypothetical protein